ncbi:hypothetical protein BgiBS90_002565 [Biomphalaria glabrata]|nr:hypothetical protein BgiBS90_002565 [Biomphalaria glabrata]
MGACYSKHIESHEHRPTKLPSSKRKRKNVADYTSPETALLNTEDGNLEVVHIQKEILPSDKSNSNYVPSRSSTPELTPNITVNNKKGDGGVAPSDSGIESIGIAPEEIQEPVASNTDHDELTKKLERLSRGSCARCGNFKLDDSAFTALLADTYCSCGPRLAGRSNINPHCKTHGQKKQISADGNECRTSNLKKTADVQNAKSVRISVQSAGTLSSAVNETDLLLDSNDFFQAPLAHFDSLDIIDHMSQSKQKRRSLLSEILNITDSICRCDFYSNEYYCSEDKHYDVDMPEESHSPLNDSSLVSGGKTSSQSHMNCYNPNDQFSKCQVESLQEVISNSKKSASLPKNVSFAAQNSIEKEISSKPRMSEECCISQETCALEASSGILTHNSTSDPLLSKLSAKGNHKRTLSLNSQGALLSDSSIEVLNNFTEEDLVSLDLDSVASLSHNSLKYLIDSSEDLASSTQSVDKMRFEGADYLLIPQNIYHQIQSDLGNLKQQLLNLSTLIQEDSEDQ